MWDEELEVSICKDKGDEGFCFCSFINFVNDETPDFLSSCEIIVMCVFGWGIMCKRDEKDWDSFQTIKSWNGCCWCVCDSFQCPVSSIISSSTSRSSSGDRQSPQSDPSAAWLLPAQKTRNEKRETRCWRSMKSGAMAISCRFGKFHSCKVFFTVSLYFYTDTHRYIHNLYWRRDLLYI